MWDFKAFREGCITDAVNATDFISSIPEELPEAIKNVSGRVLRERCLASETSYFLSPSFSFLHSSSCSSSCYSSSSSSSFSGCRHRSCPLQVTILYIVQHIFLYSPSVEQCPLKAMVFKTSACVLIWDWIYRRVLICCIISRGHNHRQRTSFILTPDTHVLESSAKKGLVLGSAT